MLEHTCVIIAAFLVAVVSGSCDDYNNNCCRDTYGNYYNCDVTGLAVGIIVVICVVPLLFWGIWLAVAIIGYVKYDWQVGASLLVFFFGFYGLSCALAMEKRSQVLGRQSGAVLPPGGPYVVYTSQQYQHPGPGAPGAYSQHPGAPGAGVIHAQPVPQYGNVGVPSYEVGAQPHSPPPKHQ